MSAFGIRTVTDYYLGNNNALLFGLGTKRYSSDFDFIDSSSAILDEPWVSTIDLLYRQPLPFSLGVTAGLEGIHNTSLSDFALNPELEVSWSPNNVYSTYLSVSQSTQQLAEVSFSNTLEQPVFDLVLPLDDTVLQPSVLTLRGGGELVPVVGYEIMASFFYEQISDPLLMNHAWTGDITDQSKWLLQFQEAARSGIELSAEKRAGGSQIRLRYRMQTGTLTDQQANEFDLLGERDHRAELIFTGGLGDHGGYKLDLNLASGRHYLDASDDAAVSDFYHRVDVALFREIEINQVQGRLSLKLFNLTGARNDRLNENAWSPLTVEERALALLPFLPTLNLNFNF